MLTFHTHYHSSSRLASSRYGFLLAHVTGA
jgi:hypothetical protein